MAQNSHMSAYASPVRKRHFEQEPKLLKSLKPESRTREKLSFWVWPRMQLKTSWALWTSSMSLSHGWPAAHPMRFHDAAVICGDKDRCEKAWTTLRATKIDSGSGLQDHCCLKTFQCELIDLWVFWSNAISARVEYPGMIDSLMATLTLNPKP